LDRVRPPPQSAAPHRAGVSLSACAFGDRIHVSLFGAWHLFAPQASSTTSRVGRVTVCRLARPPTRYTDFVKSLTTANGLSKLVDKALEKRHENATRVIRHAKNEQELEVRWKETLEAGNVAAHWRSCATRSLQRLCSGDCLVMSTCCHTCLALREGRTCADYTSSRVYVRNSRANSSSANISTGRYSSRSTSWPTIGTRKREPECGSISA